MRKIRCWLLAGAVALASVVVAPDTANAGIWHEYPATANRTCSATQVFSGTRYQVCLEFNDPRSQVRTVAFISPGAYTNFQVNIKLRFGGGPDIRDSCPTMTGNSPRACYTAFTDPRPSYVVAEATFGIAGTWMAPLRALDMRLSNKQQEKSYYCGAAAAQIVLATLGISAPSQQALATQMHTSSTWGTHPKDIPGALNAYIPADDWRYHDHYSPSEYWRVAGEIVTSLSRGRPVIILVKPSELPWVNDASDFTRHYLVIHGFGGVVREGGFGVDTFKVADPWSKTEHAISVKALLDNADNAWTFSDIVRIRT